MISVKPEVEAEEGMGGGFFLTAMSGFLLALSKLISEVSDFFTLYILHIEDIPII